MADWVRTETGGDIHIIFYFWKNNYSHIKVRARGADTCTDCLTFLNNLKGRRLVREESEESDMSISSEDEDEIERELQCRIVDVRQVMEQAREHVRQYQCQRKQSKIFIELAKMDVENKIPKIFRRRVLTIDMGQNLSLPNLEGEQPGDTYYFLPLTAYLFGVVDNATDDGDDRMRCYTWLEGEADRGANNICSCLLKDFKCRGFLDQTNYGSLTIIADNCGGQNKNKHVVRLLMWLVEMHYFPQINLFF